MGVSLNGNWFVHYNWLEWGCLCKIALQFGWQPQGTEPSDYVSSVELCSCYPTNRFCGCYFSNDDQTVTQSDAAEMGAALSRAAEAMRRGALTPEEREVIDPMPLSMIEEMAAFAVGGSFSIG